MKRFVLVVVTSDGSDLSELETGLKKLVHSIQDCKNTTNHAILHVESVSFSIVNGVKSLKNSQVSWRQQFEENIDAELNTVLHVTQWNGDDLADYLHNLADQLPDFGSYLLDVVWVIVGEDAPSPENNLGLYGAFKRLQSWHKAHFTICHHKGQLFSTNPSVNTCDWVEMLSAQTVNIHHLGSAVTQPGTVWMGNICWWDQQNSEMKQFGCFRMVSRDDENKNKLEKDVCISENVMLLSVCRLESVPLYLFSPHRFELLPVATEVSGEFLQLFENCSSNRCAVLRLSYCRGGVLKTEKDNPFSTERWRMQIAMGVIQYPQWHPKGVVEYVHFLLANGTLYQLRCTSELNGLSCHKLATISNVHRTLVPNTDTDTILNAIPHFNSHQLHQLDKIVTTNQCVTSDFDDLYFANKALEIIVSRNLQTTERSNTAIKVSQQSVNRLDYTNCAEIRALRLRSSMSESFCRYKSSDTLGGFAPPVLAFKSPEITVKDLLLFFTDKGEARNKELRKTSVFNNGKVLRIGSNDRESADADWPLCKLSLFHDVYYNTGSDSEKIELRAGKLREQFLHIDTISTRDQFISPDECNVNLIHEEIQVSPRTKRTKLIGNEPLRRSPRKRKLVTPLEPNPKRRKDDIKTESIKSAKKNEKCSNSEDLLKRKVRVAVTEALESKGIGLDHPLFKSCGKRLFTICQTFSQDVIGKGKTSVRLKKIADSHVIPVVEFYQHLKKQSPKGKNKPK